MRRPFRGSIVLFVAALTLAACGGSDESSEPGGTTTVKVGLVPILDVAPVYLGVEQGFFEKQGLKLELQTAQGGAAIVPGGGEWSVRFRFQ
ncbi:hypothetical protein Kisp02_68390 [Kineosporia sp. NBRC 101731]|nr:ABC transporter substrate-binding protein [Kineosporia sp. NBRC 101731]GLY33474.1 hypothetical protein Kisp02_68390 [Kineosporia sp. NBRC 101731]